MDSISLQKSYEQNFIHNVKLKQDYHNILVFDIKWNDAIIELLLNIFIKDITNIICSYYNSEYTITYDLDNVFKNEIYFSSIDNLGFKLKNISSLTNMYLCRSSYNNLLKHIVDSIVFTRVTKDYCSDYIQLMNEFMKVNYSIPKYINNNSSIICKYNNSINKYVTMNVNNPNRSLWTTRSKHKIINHKLFEHITIMFKIIIDLIKNN